MAVSFVLEKYRSVLEYSLFRYAMIGYAYGYVISAISSC